MSFTLESILQEFTSTTVMVVGDVMLDCYLYGKVNRISPEAPVPIVDIKEEVYRLGGAANVALNIKALGATPILVGILGKDDSAKKLSQLMETHEMDASQLIEVKHRPTTVKTRVMAGSQQLIRLDSEETKEIDQRNGKRLLANIEKIMLSQTVDVLLIQDYNKGVCSPQTIEGIIQLAKKYEIPIAVDPKVKNFWHYKGVNLIKPNLKEVESAIGHTFGSALQEMEQSLSELREGLEAAMAMVTLSEHGIVMSDPVSIVHERAILKTDIVDVCGAGDAVFSIAALGLSKKLSMSMMSVLGNLAGGQVCQRIGVCAIDKEKLIYDWNVWQKKSEENSTI